MTASNIPRSAIVAACADMIRACGLTVQEIVDELAKPQQAQPLGMLPLAGEVDIDAAHARKPAPIVTLPPEPAVRALNANDRRVIDASVCADGITVAGVMALLGLQEAQAHRILSLLADGHHLTRVKKPGIRAMHFFARPADALAWSQAAVPAPPAPEPPKPPHKPVPTAKQNITFSGPKPAEQLKPKGEPVITSDTRVTLDTTKRPNYRHEALQLEPDPRYPSFASMRPGVNPDTGKAWGARP